MSISFFTKLEENSVGVYWVKIEKKGPIGNCEFPYSRIGLMNMYICICI